MGSVDEEEAMHSRAWSLVYLLSIICLLLLLWGGTNISGSRLVNGMWNLGHVVAFFVWSLLFFRLTLYYLSFPRFALLTLILCACVGILIEFVQSSFSKYFSITDLLNNFTGTCFALTVLALRRKGVPVLTQLILLSSSLVLGVVSLYPMALVVNDEVRMYSSFPVLVDFDSPHHLSRVDAKRMSITGAPDNENLTVLKLDFDTSTYSGFSLKYFVSDWSEYSNVVLRFYLQQTTPLNITCRINDRQHDLDGYAHNDRYNQRFVLSKGWNVIEISLNDVRDSPANRLLDLTQVANLGCFVVRQSLARTIWLDSIVLH